MRTFSNTSLVNKPPCGDADKSFIHYMATPNSRNLIQWKVLHPSSNGTCTVRIGMGLDEDQYVTLYPRDGSADTTGSFVCGREIGYDSKEFRFPKNISCDSCTLQFEFTTTGGQIHQCADIMVESSECKQILGV